MIEPVYVTDKETFKRNVRDFRSAVKRSYANYNMGYSYKTNYVKCFRDATMELGEYAEVVSPKEYAMAVEDGNRRIIYNGLIPDLEKLPAAVEGAIVNVENVRELADMQAQAEAMGVKARIGVRLNIDVGNGYVSRFGIDTDGDDYRWVIDSRNHPNLDIASVHCHVSNARSLDFFRARVRLMCEKALELGAGIVDIGGNMYGHMTEKFKAQFPGHVPTFIEYAETIGGEMRKFFPDESVNLITEDGTPVVSNAMHLKSTVLNVKKARGCTFIDVNTKREDVGASCWAKDPSYLYVGECGEYHNGAIVSGCTCVEVDRMIREYDGYAEPGGNIYFLNIGAYSVNSTNDFITDGCRSTIDVNDLPDGVAEQIRNACK